MGAYVVTGLLILFVVLVVVRYIKQKREEHDIMYPKADSRPVWADFLGTMETVFRGTGRKGQQLFLEKNKKGIDYWRENDIEFEKKYNAIIVKYAK